MTFPQLVCYLSFVTSNELGPSLSSLKDALQIGILSVIAPPDGHGVFCLLPYLAVVRGWIRKFCHSCYNLVHRHDRLRYYTLMERATCLLYNDAKIMYERNKYVKIDAMKDTWGKTFLNV